MLFTKPKFLRLDSFSKHKKCAEMLRLIYEKLLKKEDISALFAHYNELLSWMGGAFFEKKELKKIADQYHMHLKKAKVDLKEHNLLPHLRTGDREAKKKF